MSQATAQSTRPSRPRVLVLEDDLRLQQMLSTVLRLEDYEVEGGTPPDSNSKFVPAGSFRRYRDHDADTTITDPEVQKQISDSIHKTMRACMDSVTKEVGEEEYESRRDKERQFAVVGEAKQVGHHLLQKRVVPPRC